MVWVLSLSDMDLSTHALTPGVPVIVFGVCQVLIGVETLATYQWLYLYYILPEAAPKCISGSTSYVIRKLFNVYRCGPPVSVT